MDGMTHKQLTLLVSALGLTGTLVALITYFRDRKLKDNLLQLEHDLKLLEIEKAKSDLIKN